MAEKTTDDALDSLEGAIRKARQAGGLKNDSIPHAKHPAPKIVKCPKCGYAVEVDCGDIFGDFLKDLNIGG